MLRHKILLYILIGASVIAALLIIDYLTNIAIGVSPDSAVYISVARNLVRGNGLTTYEGKPLVAFPPIYPLMLSAAGLIYKNIFTAARDFQAGLFALNILVLDLIIYRMSQRSLVLVLANSLILLTSFSLLIIHSMAWSEPAYILLSMVSLSLLAAYIQRPKIILVIASSLLITAAILTRYVGLALIPTALLSVWLLGAGIPTRRKLLTSGIFLLGLLGFGLWTWRNILLGESAVNRDFIFHPILLTTLKEGYYTVARWFFLDQANKWLRMVVLALIGITMLFLLFRRYRGGIAKEKPLDFSLIMQSVLLIYLACYLLVVLLTSSFIDINTIMDYRILSPLFPVVLILILTAAWDALTSSPAVWKYALAAIALAALVAMQTNRSYDKLQPVHDRGAEFMNMRWEESEVLKAVGQLAPGVPISSNGPDLISARLDRQAVYLPECLDRYSQADNPCYLEEIENLKTLLGQGGVMVWINDIDWRNYLVDLDDLHNYVCLTPLVEVEDGGVYHACGQ